MIPQLRILVAEDNVDYAFFLERALQSIELTGSVTIVSDGSYVIDYLSGTGRYQCPTGSTAQPEGPALPDLIFTDLKMPCLNGFGILRWLQAHPEYPIPTIVLSSSADEDDILMAYELGASAYLIKPANLLEMHQMLRAVLQFWALRREPARGLQSA